MISAEVVLASRNPTGRILWTLELTYPRFIHSEILTHRDRARNSGSSRAIPWPVMCERIREDPVIPVVWGTEKSGMQTGDALVGDLELQAREIWLDIRDYVLAGAQKLANIGVHKSLCNRVTEPWMWITVVMSSTAWKNFFRLRAHKDAEIHFQILADRIKEAMDSYEPQKLSVGQWHLPYCDLESDREEARNDDEILAKVSTARCARVSVVQHGEKRKSVEKDLKLFERLFTGSGFGHWSPMEHPAEAMSGDYRSGPFVGFEQFRKKFPELENVEG